MGLIWIPMAIGIQFLLLYVVLGGPGRVLAGFSGQRSLLGIDGLGTLQIGLPVAMVLAFPSLAALAAVEKWVHPVGWLDVVLVQGLSLLVMLRRLRRTSPVEATPGPWSDNEAVIASVVPPAAFTPVSAPTLAVVASPPPVPVVAVAVEIPPPAAAVPWVEAPPVPSRIAVPPSPVSPAAAVKETPAEPTKDVQPEPRAEAPEAPALPAAPLEARQLTRELAKIYGWNRVGLERPFVEVRQNFRAWGAHPASPDARVAAWRRIARDTLSALRRDGGALPLEEFFSERVLEADEYERDVMRRLSLSVLVGHDRLFIDPSDLEMCGEDMVVAMYRQALLELGAEGGVTYH